jgi:hypothetical protein
LTRNNPAFKKAGHDLLTAHDSARCGSHWAAFHGSHGAKNNKTLTLMGRGTSFIHGRNPSILNFQFDEPGKVWQGILT